MQLMHSSRVRCADPSADRAAVTRQHASHTRDARLRRIAALAFVVFLSAVLGACSSGGGGDNGEPNPLDERTATGLVFSYPFDGQQDVLLDTQMVVKFDEDVGNIDEDALKLVYGPENDPKEQSLTARLNPNGSGTICLAPGENIQIETPYTDLCIQGGEDLVPNSDYRVVANKALSDGTTTIPAGETLFSFRTRPAEGRPAPNGEDLQVVAVTPGPDSAELSANDGSVFTQFNAIRVIFNEPVDPATVNDSTFIVSGPGGDQITSGTNGGAAEARLTALGRYIVFDPVDDLEPGQYTIEWTDGIASQFQSNDNNTSARRMLAPGSVQRTVLTVGEKPTDQVLTIEEKYRDKAPSELPQSILNGARANNVNITSQLIGRNQQPVVSGDGEPPFRQSLATSLADPRVEAFGDVIPAVIRSGQKFQVEGLTLKLGGEIATPISPSEPIDVNFINDVSVYLMSNDLRDDPAVTPTAVRLRFDLGIGTLITEAFSPGEPKPFVVQQLANGVFTQSILNIQAAGLVIPQDNGDLRISVLGSFPINVNRTDNATVDFELTLVLPADPDAQIDQAADTLPPYVTAQSPSACLYVFGSSKYDEVYAQYNASGSLPRLAPTSLPEPQCRQILEDAVADGDRPVPPYINSFPVESSPAVIFNAPIAPTTVNDQSVQLFVANDDGTVQGAQTPVGDPVPATYRVEGFSVVIDPVNVLDADTPYVIQLDQSILADLAGNDPMLEEDTDNSEMPNRLSGNPGGPGFTMTFRTEPLVDTDPTPPLLGTLTPGTPCALEGGDFETGGSTAGNCVGSDTASAAFEYPVFQSPVDVPVDAVFSKFVDSSSIVLANGCLTAGSGDGNTVTGASVALQKMDGNGQCIGTPDAKLALANPGDAVTRSFTIRPAEYLDRPSRYWIVVCGTDANQCTRGTPGSIMDTAGNVLNTDPLNGTGSTATSTGTAGGPDIVMPFDTIAANEDYYTNQFTLPETDTNGNGQFDDADSNGVYDSGDERPQPGNRALVQLALGGGEIENGDRPDGKYPSYLALARPIAIRLARPIAIREVTDQCDRVNTVTFDDDSNAVDASTPESCIPVSLLPGGINSLTAIDIPVGEALAGLGANVTGPLEDVSNVVGGVLEDVPVVGPILGLVPEVIEGVGSLLDNAIDVVGGVVADLEGQAPTDSAFSTGRIILRFPNDNDGNGPQTGYIVERCQGTFPDGPSYDFEPCFAASLALVANAPDGQAVALEQQQFTANIVGPVTFEQNGRLVISVRNANTIELNATALGVLPATATIAPADLNFQLVGNPVHGGRAFPNR